MALERTIIQCGGGVNKDLLPGELGPSTWSDSANVRFANGFATSRAGMSAAFSPPEVIPYAVEDFSTNDARYIVRAGAAQVWADDGSDTYDITPETEFTGDADDRWTLCVFNGVFIANHPIDGPFYWNGETDTQLAPLPNWPTGQTVRAMRAFKNFLIGIAPTIDDVFQPHIVLWSESAEPGAIPDEWNSTSTNDAGSTPQTAATGGHLVDGCAGGDRFYLYKTDSIYALDYIGGNDVFACSRIPGNDGLVAVGCVVDTPKGQVFLSNGDFRIHQGGESSSLVEGRMRDWLTTLIDTVYVARSFLAVDQQNCEVWCVFPAYAEVVPKQVLAWNWNENLVYPYQLATGITCACSGLVPSGMGSDAWDEDVEEWDEDLTRWTENLYSSNQQRLIVCSTTAVGLANVGSLDFGAEFDWHLERVGIDLGDPDRLKVISRLRPHLQASGIEPSILVSYGTSKTGSGAGVTYTSPASYVQGTTDWVNRRTTAGRYAAVRFEGSEVIEGVRPQVSIRSYEVEFSRVGRF